MLTQNVLLVSKAPQAQHVQNPIHDRLLKSGPLLNSPCGWRKTPDHPSAQGRGNGDALQPVLAHTHLSINISKFASPTSLHSFHFSTSPTSTLSHFYLDGCNHLLVSRHPLWSPPISTSPQGVLPAILPLNYSYSAFRSQLRTTSSRQIPRDLS